MRLFIVGGYVRDMLLGRVSQDRDFVVVGATAEQMLAMGYEQVGADFPVFLKEGEEYALARTERKKGIGYHGFDINSDPTITIQQDLLRRDLTINAMCIEVDPNTLQPLTGEIIDPYGGQEDIKNHTLRHVSVAFKEDPLRVMRVARFAARYGFKIASETKDFMKEMVEAGELNHLTPERVMAETQKALEQSNVLNLSADHFFQTLLDCNALDVVYGVGGCNYRLADDYDPGFYWPSHFMTYDASSVEERWGYYFSGKREDYLRKMKFSSSHIDMNNLIAAIQEEFRNQAHLRTPENFVALVRRFRLTSRMSYFNRAMTVTMMKMSTRDDRRDLWMKFGLVSLDLNTAARIISGITIDPTQKGDMAIRDYVDQVYVAAIKKEMFS